MWSSTIEKKHIIEIIVRVDDLQTNIPQDRYNTYSSRNNIPQDL
jgi:hypothetical protein